MPILIESYFYYMYYIKLFIYKRVTQINFHYRKFGKCRKTFLRGKLPIISFPNTISINI